jgi:hypothetical protein
VNDMGRLAIPMLWNMLMITKAGDFGGVLVPLGSVLPVLESFCGRIGWCGTAVFPGQESERGCSGGGNGEPSIKKNPRM